MRRRRAGEGKKGKKVTYELIPRQSTLGFAMYRTLDDLVAMHHEHLRDARIALAWNTGWKPDADGREVIGKCKKASDLDRELAAYDFIILLSRRFWNHLRTTAEQRTALLDHELCHAQVKIGENGEPMRDERDRIVYRLRKHDLEEFADVVSRHGMYKRDIELFAAALRRAPSEPFKPCEECAYDVPGWREIEDPAGVRRRQRCQCWIEWTANMQLTQASA